MLSDFLAVGANEIFNTERLRAYLENVGSPFTSGSGVCGCDTLTPAMVDDDDTEYTTPTEDPAPWYDADLPESGDFLGFLPLSIDGIDGSVRARNVTNAVGGGGVFGPARDLPRTITVTGLLIGVSCCGVDYGLHWLGEALAGCSGSSCGGDCATMYNCCPEEEMTRQEFRDLHERTFVRVALVSGPTVTERTGTGTCARDACNVGGDIVQVEFVLVAASPWPWTAPIPVLDVALPIGGTGDCIEWCTDCPPSECAYAPCIAASSACADPRNPVPAPPQPTIPTAGFCIPVGAERACYSVDLSDRPGWANDVPIVTITSGSEELRNVRVVIYERPHLSTQTCDEIAESQRCNPQNEFYVTYIPAGSAVTFDGRTGFATTECAGECESAVSAFGDQDGGPVRFNDMTCSEYCVCIETDTTQPPAADAKVTMSVAGKGY